MPQIQPEEGTHLFNLAGSFSLQEFDGRVYTADDLCRDVHRAGEALNECKHLTIDASHVRATLVGLLLTQRFGLNVGLARDINSVDLQEHLKQELVPGVFAWLDHDAVPSSPGIRVFTSGTTGKAKIAFHDLKRLIASISVRAPDASTTWLLTYEPASYAGIQVILTAAMNGARLLSPDRSISALAASITQGVTHISATPSFWRALLTALSSPIAANLKVVTLGGETCPQNLLEELKNRFHGAVIRQIYASTEAGVGFVVSDGMAGFPAAWLDVSVQGVQLRVRENELEIRTQRGMLAYIGDGLDPFEAGWLRTGDLVEIQQDRVLFTGRRDNVVNIGGTKVVPEKVEAVLCNVEGVSDITVSAYPNPILGFILIAHVCASPEADREKVQSALKLHAAAHLPPMARPASYRFVEGMVLSNGKKARKNVSY